MPFLVPLQKKTNYIIKDARSISRNPNTVRRSMTWNTASTCPMLWTMDRITRGNQLHGSLHTIPHLHLLSFSSAQSKTRSLSLYDFTGRCEVEISVKSNCVLVLRIWGEETNLDIPNFQSKITIFCNLSVFLFQNPHTASTCPALTSQGSNYGFMEATKL